MVACCAVWQVGSSSLRVYASSSVHAFPPLLPELSSSLSDRARHSAVRAAGSLPWRRARGASARALQACLGLSRGARMTDTVPSPPNAQALTAAVADPEAWAAEVASASQVGGLRNGSTCMCSPAAALTCVAVVRAACASCPLQAPAADYNQVKQCRLAAAQGAGGVRSTQGGACARRTVQQCSLPRSR